MAADMNTQKENVSAQTKETEKNNNNNNNNNRQDVLKCH